MVKPFPSKTHIGNYMLHPETLMLNYGYDPQLSEGAVKRLVFLTSTFVFRTAEDGQDFFDFVSGRREPPEGMGAGLVYSRFNHVVDTNGLPVHLDPVWSDSTAFVAGAPLSWLTWSSPRF
jgi:hypothetical protein